MNIGLGAVQFGLDYGISGVRKKTPQTEVVQLLEFATIQGMHVLDTAPSYGDSEDVIGKFIRSHDNRSHWNIVTKTPYFKNKIISSKQIDELISSFELSRKKLGLDMLYGLLIHNYDNLFSTGGDKLLQAMIQLKKKKVVKKIGVSVYSSKQIDHILDCFPNSIDLVQLPFSILDQRLLKGGQLNRLKECGVEIHARSVFLQGLLFMPLEILPSWFNPIMETLEAFHMEAKKRNMSALQLAIGFVQSVHEIDKIIVGVNTLKQLDEIIKASSIYVDLKQFSSLSINNPAFLNPSNWRV
jgi:aryl-alcohol dehydrogenase-like predicted oxidoreductase